MRIILFNVVFIFFLNSCKNISNELTIQTNGQLTLIDSTSHTENFISYNPRENIGFYPIYYVGADSDTLHLRKTRIPRYGYGEKDYSDKKYYPLLDSIKLSLVVDTAFDLAYKVDFTRFPLNEDKPVIDSSISYKAYPVIIKNLSDSLLYIGDCWDWDNIVRQVKNEKGYWVDIEDPIEYFCGTGCRPIILEPHQILIAKAVRYKGNHKVESRLKYTAWKHIIYSNSFIDNIDLEELRERM